MEKSITIYVAGIAWPDSPGHAAFGWTAEGNGIVFKKTSRYVAAKTTDAVAEYAGFVDALDWLRSVGKIAEIYELPVDPTQMQIIVRMNNLMIIRQMKGEWKAKPPFIPMRQTAQTYAEPFQSLRFEHVPRSEVFAAKELAAACLTKLGYKSGFQG